MPGSGEFSSFMKNRKAFGGVRRLSICRFAHGPGLIPLFAKST